ncbi:MAG: CorA family divalent cation transporter [Microvirga sp.]
MIHAFLYDADGHDQEVDLDAQCMAGLNERSLLWVDVQGRDRREMETLVRLFSLDHGSLRELLNPQEALYLDNYGEYFQFDIVGFSTGDAQNGERSITKRHPAHMEFLVGHRWIITVHEGEIPFLQAFRDQNKGETLIGALSPPALAASLLDWHLTTYFEAVTELEALLDRLDEAMLARSARKSLLAGVVATRRRVSELRRLLAVQRPVFYGLSRPDFVQVVESDAAAHYRSLERRFERAVDAVDHARELVNGSFDLYTTRTAEATNDLVRRLTFVTMMLGVVGAIAGIFGMNFETPYTKTGVEGFWIVLVSLALFALSATVIAMRKAWI